MSSGPQGPIFTLWFSLPLKVLVEATCQINKADRTGCSPLYHAVKSGQRELSSFLVDHGACVNQANQSGDRPIHVAALHGKLTKSFLTIPNLFLKFFFVGHIHMSYFVATGTPVLDVQRRLFWVSKPEWVLPYSHGGGEPLRNDI